MTDGKAAKHPRGAHAPRVLSLAPSPKTSVSGHSTQFSTRASKTTRESACSPHDFWTRALSAKTNFTDHQGTANLNGDFTIDTTAVTVTTGTWTLVDTATKSFGSTFTVVDFTPNVDGVTWAMSASGMTWTFVETTGVLTLTVSGSDYDTWAAAYLPEDVSNPAADNDGDGLTNQQEYAFGLNPTLGSSANPITAPLDKTTGMFTYTRRATPLTTGLTYSVLISTDLAIWTEDITATQTVTGTVGDVETVDVTLSGTPPLTDPALFVRIQAAPTP